MQGCLPEWWEDRYFRRGMDFPDQKFSGKAGSGLLMRMQRTGKSWSGVPERELPVVLVPDTEGVSVREPESCKGVVVSHSFSADGDGLYFAVQAQECLAVFNTEDIVGSVEDSAALLEKVAESSTVLALVRRQTALRYSVRA